MEPSGTSSIRSIYALWKSQKEKKGGENIFEEIMNETSQIWGKNGTFRFKKPNSLLWDTTEAALRSLWWYTHTLKKKKAQTNNPILHLKKLEKK